MAGRIEAQARGDAPDWGLIDDLLDQLPGALDRVAAAADERRERAL